MIDKDDNTEEPVLRTIVADDDPLVRRLIRDTLQRANVTVIAEASTGREAVELALFYRPDVVVMDFMMPEMDGIEATRRIYEHDPSIRVVLLTGAGDEELGLRGLRAGASGYLSKEVELEALPRALRGALEGEAAISRQLAMKLIERYRAAPTGGAGLRPVRSRLTDREWEVLDLLSTGATTDQIAKNLVLSSETVRSHLKNLYRKLEVNSRDEAVRAASRLRSLSGLPARVWPRRVVFRRDEPPSLDGSPARGGGDARARPLGDQREEDRRRDTDGACGGGPGGRHRPACARRADRDGLWEGQQWW